MILLKLQPFLRGPGTAFSNSLLPNWAGTTTPIIPSGQGCSPLHFENDWLRKAALSSTPCHKKEQPTSQSIPSLIFIHLDFIFPEQSFAKAIYGRINNSNSRKAATYNKYSINVSRKCASSVIIELLFSTVIMHSINRVQQKQPTGISVLEKQVDMAFV